jgi:DNA-binding MarR family transcriptional regulator
MPRRSLEAEVADFAHSIGLLIRKVRAAAASHGLSLSESSVIARLSREGPATTAELARIEGVRPQSMGATISALEDAGLVQRSPHPTDGRQMNVGLTEKGVALRKNIGETKRTWLASEISRLDDGERETLFHAGEIIRKLLNED